MCQIQERRREKYIFDVNKTDLSSLVSWICSPLENVEKQDPNSKQFWQKNHLQMQQLFICNICIHHSSTYKCWDQDFKNVFPNLGSCVYFWPDSCAKALNFPFSFQFLIHVVNKSQGEKAT